MLSRNEHPTLAVHLNECLLIFHILFGDTKSTLKSVWISCIYGYCSPSRPTRPPQTHILFRSRLDIQWHEIMRLVNPPPLGWFDIISNPISKQTSDMTLISPQTWASGEVRLDITLRGFFAKKTESQNPTRLLSIDCGNRKVLLPGSFLPTRFSCGQVVFWAF